MTRIPSIRTFSLALLLACGVASSANAQDTLTTPQPSNGIFLGDQRGIGAGQSLVLTGAIFETYDSRIAGPVDSVTGASDPLRGASGYNTMTRAGLFYGGRTRRVTLGASGDAVFAFYPDLRPDVPQPVDSYSGNGDITVELGRSSLRASQSVRYEPYFVVQVLPPVVDLVGLSTAPQNFGFNPRFSLLENPALLYHTAGSFTTPVGRRSSLDFSYGRQGGSYSGNLFDTSSQSGRAQLNHAMTRNVQLRGSYTFQLATYQRPTLPENTVREHDVEAGFSYRRAFSRTRGFRVDAGAGGSRFEDDTPVTPGTGRHQQLNAYFGLNLNVARSWNVRGGFRRSLQLLQGLGQPYYGTSENVGFSGGLSRRMDLSGSASYSRGDIGIDAVAQGYDTRSASLRLRYALSPELGLSAEYGRTEYNFTSGANLPTGFVRVANRNSMRFGLVFGKSLLGRQATSNAP